MDTMDALRRRILFLEIQFLIIQQQLQIPLENSKDNFLFFILKNERESGYFEAISKIFYVFY